MGDAVDGARDTADVLIVGAGPTGLAAALFLAERGHRPRVLEQRRERAPWSRAFGVNARTLELLAPSGVTDRFLAGERRLERLTLRRHDRPLATLRLDEVEHRYPFMLIQGQAESERLLEAALGDRGVRVERGVEVVGLGRDGVRAHLDVVRPGGERRALTARCVLGADGAGSGVRRALGIAFDGEAYAEPWRLYDVELTGPLPRDEASILLLDDGGVFVVRLTDDVWRVLGNVPDLLERLPPGTAVGRVHWQSEFGIANRAAARFADPPFYLAGDAAHVHAGIGARGMNLGVEDAYVFAALYDAAALDRYAVRREPTVRKVVRQIRRAMGPPRPSTLEGRAVRAAPWAVPLLVAVARGPAQRWILGLDHALEL